jgi:hypothetical protein
MEPATPEVNLYLFFELFKLLFSANDFSGDGGLELNPEQVEMSPAYPSLF